MKSQSIKKSPQHRVDQQGIQPAMHIPTKWSVRAFQALDFDNRGYIFKDEILAHIKASGTYKSHQIRDLVQILEAKSSKDRIDLNEFEELIKGRNFIKNVLENNLVIPQYQLFGKNFK